ARDEEFTRSARGGVSGPLNCIHARGVTASMREDLPLTGLAAAPTDTASIDRDDDALAAEAVRTVVDQLRRRDGARVDAYLIGAEFEHDLHVSDAANTATDGERDKHFGGRGGDHVVHGTAVVGAGCDIEEYELVSAFLIVQARELDRVSGVAELDEGDAFDHAAGVDIEAGDDAAAQHCGAPGGAGCTTGWARTAASASGRSSVPSYSALPTIAPSQPIRARRTSCSMVLTPPDATTGTGSAATSASRAAKFGPDSMPSRPMSVNMMRRTPLSTIRWARSVADTPEPSSQPLVRTSPSLASIETTMPAGCATRASQTRAGLLTAALPS